MLSSKEEVNHTCRGTLVLVNAEIKTGVGHNFIVGVAGAYADLEHGYYPQKQAVFTRAQFLQAVSFNV